MDKYLRDEALALMHLNQHAYQAGKSVETAHQQLTVQAEKVLDQQEIALRIFLDTEGAFNNTCYDTMCDALVRHGSDYTIVRWIRVILEGRVAVETLNVLSMRLAISMGYPHGGVLSLLQCCLVVDNLLARLSGNGYLFMDTQVTCLLAVGKSQKHSIKTHSVGSSNRRYMVQRGRTIG